MKEAKDQLTVLNRRNNYQNHTIKSLAEDKNNLQKANDEMHKMFEAIKDQQELFKKI